jgi:ATP synthase E chain.
VTKRAEIEHEYARKERLIEQAKAEYKKKTQPQQETKTQTSGRTFDYPPMIQLNKCNDIRSRRIFNNPSADQNSIVITNFEDPKFDLEAFLKAKAGE